MQGRCNWAGCRGGAGYTAGAAAGSAAGGAAWDTCGASPAARGAGADTAPTVGAVDPPSLTAGAGNLVPPAGRWAAYGGYHGPVAGCRGLRPRWPDKRPPSSNR